MNKNKHAAIASTDSVSRATLTQELIRKVRGRARSEPITPQLLDACLEHIGGVKELGKICAEELRKSRGETLDGDIIPGLDGRPTLTHQWMSLLTKIIQDNDQRESLDISSLPDKELLATLKSLAIDLIRESDEYRRFLLKEIIKEDPSLIHLAMNWAGLPVIDSKAIGHQGKDESRPEDPPEFVDPADLTED